MILSVTCSDFSSIILKRFSIFTQPILTKALSSLLTTYAAVLLVPLSTWVGFWGRVLGCGVSDVHDVVHQRTESFTFYRVLMQLISLRHTAQHNAAILRVASVYRTF